MHTLSSAEVRLDSPVPPDVSPAQKLAEIAQEYPAALIQRQLQDIDRMAYHLALVQRYGKPGGRICDIGGGVGLFSPGCAALGFSITLVDDFRDDVNLRTSKDAFAAHDRRGVKIISCDVV